MQTFHSRTAGIGFLVRVRTGYQTDAKSAIDTATSDYETKTGHGKTQTAVGGDNVHLACP